MFRFIHWSMHHMNCELVTQPLSIIFKKFLQMKFIKKILIGQLQQSNPNVSSLNFLFILQIKSVSDISTNVNNLYFEACSYCR